MKNCLERETGNLPACETMMGLCGFAADTTDELSLKFLP